MNTKLLKAIHADKRFVISLRQSEPGFPSSGWWYLTDTKMNKSVRHKRIRNILNEYKKLYIMKNTIKYLSYLFAAIALCFLAVAITSCHKQVIKPVGTPIVPITNLYDYRAYGLTASDTAEIYINSKKVDSFRGYHITINKGDTVTMYYSSKNKNYDFAIWNAGNFAISETIKYFYPEERKKFKYTVYTGEGVDPGNGSSKILRDSINVYDYRYFIRVTFIN